MPSENKDKKEEQEQKKKKNSDNNEKYHANPKNNKENKNKNKLGIPKQSSSSNEKEESSNKKNSQDNNKQNIQDNNKKDESKKDPKQQLKEQGAAAAISALGVPAPLAQALAKPAVNKLDNQKKLLNEQQQIKQGQERLDNIRNIAGAMNESKKEKQEEAEEQQPASLIDQAEDIKAKAENVSGFVRFLKMIPAPVWGVIGAIIGLLFFFLILFSALNSSTVWASVMQDYLVETNPSNSDANNNSQPAPNQGTGKLGYPTDSRSISAGFPNYSSGAYHGGVDFPVATGSNVYAAEAGEVIVKKQLNYSYGYYLYIKHDNGLCTLYAHNSKLLVNKGDKVTKGQVIAKSGSTGNSTGPHCHFEVRTDCGVSGGSPSGTRVNPNNYLSE